MSILGYFTHRKEKVNSIDGVLMPDLNRISVCPSFEVAPQNVLSTTFLTKKQCWLTDES